MTTQDIKEVRLIAKFMGWIPIVTDYHGINLFEYPDENKTKYELKTASLYDLYKQYKSYSIMEVVDKIESDKAIAFNICQSTVNVAYNTDYSTEKIIIVDILGTKKEAIFQGCVEYIEWDIKNKLDLVTLCR